MVGEGAILGGKVRDGLSDCEQTQATMHSSGGEDFQIEGS